MGVPQVIYLVLVLSNLLLAAYLNGQLKTGKHSLPMQLFATVLSITLLWYGGFFW